MYLPEQKFAPQFLFLAKMQPWLNHQVDNQETGEQPEMTQSITEIVVQLVNQSTI